MKAASGMWGELGRCRGSCSGGLCLSSEPALAMAVATTTRTASTQGPRSLVGDASTDLIAMCASLGVALDGKAAEVALPCPGSRDVDSSTRTRVISRAKTMACVAQELSMSTDPLHMDGTMQSVDQTGREWMERSQAGRIEPSSPAGEPTVLRSSRESPSPVEPTSTGGMPRGREYESEGSIDNDLDAGGGGWERPEKTTTGKRPREATHGGVLAPRAADRRRLFKHSAHKHTQTVTIISLLVSIRSGLSIAENSRAHTDRRAGLSANEAGRRARSVRIAGWLGASPIIGRNPQPAGPQTNEARDSKLSPSSLRPSSSERTRPVPQVLPIELARPTASLADSRVSSHARLPDPPNMLQPPPHLPAASFSPPHGRLHGQVPRRALLLTSTF